MTAPALADARPRLRADVILGPAVLRDAAYFHVVKDPHAGRSYEVGPRECFIMSRLDGDRTLGEVGAAYQAAFGRSLDDRSWTQLLGLLGGRRLLAGAPPSTADPAPAGPRPSSLREGRLVLGDPSRLVDALLTRLGFLFTPAFAWAAAAAVLAAGWVVGAHLGGLWQQTVAVCRDPWQVIGVLAVVWLGAALHEVAHGLAGRRFGGTATEIGLQFRPPLILAYCRVDDVLLFRSRWHRVATAAAGPLLNLLQAVPLVPLWLLLPDGSAGRPFTGAVILFSAAHGLGNLVPVPPMDGYRVLGYALNVADLAAGSRRFVLQPAKQKATYPRWSRFAYTGYAATLLILLAAIALGAFVACVHLLPTPYGVLAGSGLLMLWLARTVGGRAGQRRTA